MKFDRILVKLGFWCSRLISCIRFQILQIYITLLLFRWSLLFAYVLIDDKLFSYEGRGALDRYVFIISPSSTRIFLFILFHQVCYLLQLFTICLWRLYTFWSDPSKKVNTARKDLLIQISYFLDILRCILCNWLYFLTNFRYFNFLSFPWVFQHPKNIWSLNLIFVYLIWSLVLIRNFIMRKNFGCKSVKIYSEFANLWIN